MEKDFWLERWEKEEIGFHQGDFNEHMRRYWEAPMGCEVFVPLCGKSLDMLWLRDRGHKVLGVELSEIAIRSFFEENGMEPVKTARGKFESWEAGNITLLCGDFFDLEPCDLEKTKAVYDRASLVALPIEMRKSYAEHLAEILQPGTGTLLITFDYPAHEMQGPPFAVSIGEVRALYDGCAEVVLLEAYDALAANPRFVKRGLTGLHENIFRLTMRSSRS